jgi:hypothetical protein
VERVTEGGRVSDTATVPGAEEPTHELLLALAGRVDDDLLAWCRELVAVGEDVQAVELLTATVVGDGTALPPPVRETLATAARECRVGIDVDAALPPARDEDGTEHRFVPAAAPDDRIVATLTGLPPRRLTGCRLLLTWRLTPAGAAPGPVPYPVVLVEIDRAVEPDRSAAGLAYQLTVTLARAGVHASVEVVAAGAPLPAYHTAAQRAARAIRPPGPAAPGVAARAGSGHPSRARPGGPGTGPGRADHDAATRPPAATRQPRAAAADDEVAHRSPVGPDVPSRTPGSRPAPVPTGPAPASSAGGGERTPVVSPATPSTGSPRSVPEAPGVAATRTPDRRHGEPDQLDRDPSDGADRAGADRPAPAVDRPEPEPAWTDPPQAPLGTDRLTREPAAASSDGLFTPAPLFAGPSADPLHRGPAADGPLLGSSSPAGPVHDLRPAGDTGDSLEAGSAAQPLSPPTAAPAAAMPRRLAAIPRIGRPDPSARETATRSTGPAPVRSPFEPAEPGEVTPSPAGRAADDARHPAPRPAPRRAPVRGFSPQPGGDAPGGPVRESVFDPLELGIDADDPLGMGSLATDGTATPGEGTPSRIGWGADWTSGGAVTPRGQQGGPRASSVAAVRDALRRPGPPHADQQDGDPLPIRPIVLGPHAGRRGGDPQDSDPQDSDPQDGDTPGWGTPGDEAQGSDSRGSQAPDSDAPDGDAPDGDAPGAGSRRVEARPDDPQLGGAPDAHRDTAPTDHAVHGGAAQDSAAQDSGSLPDDPTVAGLEPPARRADAPPAVARGGGPPGADRHGGDLATRPSTPPSGGARAHPGRSATPWVSAGAAAGPTRTGPTPTGPTTLPRTRPSSTAPTAAEPSTILPVAVLPAADLATAALAVWFRPTRPSNGPGPLR